MSNDPVVIAFEQAADTVSAYLAQAIELIDRRLGDGYAKTHPELLGAFILAATKDVEAMVLYGALCRIAEAIDQLEL